MKATIFLKTRSGATLIDIGDHRLQVGGEKYEGYCWFHQSFGCKLTEDEQEAIDEMEE